MTDLQKVSVKETSLRIPALIAGFGLVVTVITAIFAESFAFPKLVDWGDPTATLQNIRMAKSLFLAAIFSYLIAFVGDVAVAWALYIMYIIREDPDLEKVKGSIKSNILVNW